MKIRHRNLMRMIQATRAVLKEYRETWKNHAAFTRGVKELSDLLVSVEGVMQRQLAKAGAVVAKEEATDRLGDIAQEVPGAVISCADAMDDMETRKRISRGRSRILGGSPSQVHARCDDILVTATKLQPGLEEYGVAPARLDLLRERIAAYAEGQPKPRQRQVEDKAAGKDVADAISKMSRLLRFRLDTLVEQFQGANPHFVASYEAARRTVHRPGSLGTATPAGGETAPSTPAPGPGPAPAPTPALAPAPAPDVPHPV